jgi:hypothetical protein
MCFDMSGIIAFEKKLRVLCENAKFCHSISAFEEITYPVEGGAS